MSEVPTWLTAVLTFGGYLFTLVLLRWVLLLKKAQPSSTVAWAMAIGATLIGIGLVWSLVATEDPYGMTDNETEMIIRTLAQFLAPSLFSTGLLGIVVLVVIDGVRRARRIGVGHGGAEGRSS